MRSVSMKKLELKYNFESIFNYFSILSQVFYGTDRVYRCHEKGLKQFISHQQRK